MMSVAGLLAAMVGASLLSWLISYVLIEVLERARVVDEPNHRSLHDSVTPRGGGIAIVGTVLLAELFACWYEYLPPALMAPTIVGGIAFAGLGLADDIKPRPAVLRLAFQFVIAAGVLWLALAPGMLNMTTLLMWGGLSIACVWQVNLYNFMDGADGFAATHAALFGLGIGVIAVNVGSSHFALLPLILAAANLGFLVVNQSPAQVFMGDVGSYFVGFQIAALMYIGVFSGIPLSASLVLAAPFVVDATATLLLRIKRRERWWLAHRQHTYQLMMLNRWNASALVRLQLGSFLFFYFPIAVVTTWARFELLGLLLAYGVTVIIWRIVRLELERIR